MHILDTTWDCHYYSSYAHHKHFTREADNRECNSKVDLRTSVALKVCCSSFGYFLFNKHVFTFQCEHHFHLMQKEQVSNFDLVRSMLPSTLIRTWPAEKRDNVDFWIPRIWHFCKNMTSYLWKSCIYIGKRIIIFDEWDCDDYEGRTQIRDTGRYMGWT